MSYGDATIHSFGFELRIQPQGRWPVKLTEILTTVVALYAAILSTITLVVTIRAKRRRVAVVYTFGRTLDVGGGKPFLCAINLGERDVALKRFYVEVLSEKKNFFRTVRDALNITAGRRVTRMLADLALFKLDELRFSSRFFTQIGILKCEPTLPLLLNPGRECELVVDQTQLFDSFHFSWIARVRGVFEDERGRRYKSRTAKVDWESGIIT